MTEYIERKRALEILHEIGGCGADTGTWADGFDKAIDEAYSRIESVPAADVAPVKHGQWVYNPNGHDWNLGAWECSLCHCVNNNLPGDKRFSPYAYIGSNFCPNCGAKMDGDKL